MDIQFSVPKTLTDEIDYATIGNRALLSFAFGVDVGSHLAQSYGFVGYSIGGVLAALILFFTVFARPAHALI